MHESRRARVKGRPNPSIYVALAALGGAIATAAWIWGDSRLLAIGQTTLAVLYVGLAVRARQTMYEPLSPGRAA